MMQFWLWPDNLVIEALIDETDLRYIKIGSKLKIYLDAYPDEKFTGHYGAYSL
jgi:macrolide-specific efflux system membrane fusion protein